jgi:chemotaxis protein CheY-P-specific phosphatase CheC
MSPKIITDGTEILTQEQVDELWELGNSGAQNAATALSSLIGVPVTISVQKIIMVNWKPSELP